MCKKFGTVRFAHAETFGRSHVGDQVFVQGFGPKGGVTGSFGITPDEARKLAARLNEAAAEVEASV